MEVSIPIYVEARRLSDGVVYVCRPLFFSLDSKQDALLSRAMNKLTGKVKQHLNGLGRHYRHDELLRACFSPDVTTHNLKYTIEAKSQR